MRYHYLLCQFREVMVSKSIQSFANRVRHHILDTSVGRYTHFGGTLSLVDILAVLYKSVMNFDPVNPTDPERDRLILSKGHGVLALYATLCELGVISKSELLTFEDNNSRLLGHPTINRDIGVEFSTGSLGQGLSLGVGVALALKKRKSSAKVFVILGDGECQEGQVWEAVASAVRYELDNLTVIVDANLLQLGGETLDINLDLFGRFGEFSPNTRWCGTYPEYDLAYRIQEIKENGLKRCPSFIVSQTTKGYPFSFSSGNYEWHHKILSQAQYKLAKEELNG